MHLLRILGEEGISGRGLESRLALLPSEIRDYSSIPVESDEEIIREASHVGSPLSCLRRLRFILPRHSPI